MGSHVGRGEHETVRETQSCIAALHIKFASFMYMCEEKNLSTPIRRHQLVCFWHSAVPEDVGTKAIPAVSSNPSSPHRYFTGARTRNPKSFH